jgi:general secretion pathway protein D
MLASGWCGIWLFLVLASPLGPGAWAQVTLNLKDADISTLIDTVSTAIGMNFVVDPRVKGKVTVISARPMEDDELYQVFLSVLQVHGFTAVPVGSITKIIPDLNAKQEPTPVVSAPAPGTGEELVTQVIRTQHVPVAQLVPILRPLVPQAGQLAAYPPTNALVISDRAANIRRLVEVIQRIDRPDGGEVEVIRLNHASATEVIKVVNSLMGTGQRGQDLGERVQLAADERTNSVLMSGDSEARLRVRALVAQLDTPMETMGNAYVIYLRYAQAEELAEVLQGVSGTIAEEAGRTAGPGPQGGAPRRPGQGGEVNIQADPSNNALIITAPPDVLQTLRSIIRQLDIRRAQVLVDAVIAEVSSDLTSELGVQWAVVPDNQQGAAAAQPFAGGGRNILSVIQDPTSIANGLTIGIGSLASGDVNFAVLVTALKGDAATNILSTPSLVTMDNEEAEIIVGQNVPFITGSFTGTGSEDPQNPFQTIERQDVGLTLRIRPQINEGDAIRLEIEQEVSSLAEAAAASDVVTNKRSIKTAVLARNREVVVLGGLMDDAFRDRIEKVPGLGDLPVVGGLFRYTTTSKTKRNLMVFIHPVILDEVEVINQVARQKYTGLQAFQAEVIPKKHKGVLFEPEPTGPYPPVGELLTDTPEARIQEQRTRRLLNPPPAPAPEPEPRGRRFPSSADRILNQDY